MGEFCDAYEPQTPPYPELKLALRPDHHCPKGYDVINGHKFYRINCLVRIQDEDALTPSFEVNWRHQRRLLMLQGLHDIVKFQCGPGKYDCLFHPDAHFAR